MSGIMSLPRALLQPSTGHYRAPQPCTSGPPASRGDPQASLPFACGDHIRSGPAPVCTLCVKRCSSASAFRGGNEKAEAGASLLPSHARLTLIVLQTTAELEKRDYPPKTEANPILTLAACWLGLYDTISPSSWKGGSGPPMGAAGPRLLRARVPIKCTKPLMLQLPPRKPMHSEMPVKSK